MALLTFSQAAIKGVCACVPRRVVDNMTYAEKYPEIFSEKDVKKVIRSTGIRQRRFAAENECGSDFACQAAKKLMQDMDLAPDKIDILIYLTQTPDYLMIPPTSCVMHHRLGLPETVAAFDINLNCSGLVYALSTAFAYADGGARVLLTCGETLSKVFSPLDKNTGLLFGDGGAAIFIAPEAESYSYFSLNTDGSNFDAIIIEAGGYRNPFSPDASTQVRQSDGSIRSKLNGRMDGMRVFDFTQRVVIPDLRKVLQHAQKTTDDVNIFFFHQANRFMLNLFAAELAIDPVHIPVSLDRFGNTSTVSIPLSIVADFGTDAKVDLATVAMSAFGGGLSWGSCLLQLNDCYIGTLEEMGQ